MPAIKHIVLLKFKPDTTPDQIAKIFSDLAELQRLIPGMTDFIQGPCDSAEGLNQGFTHGFIMTFDGASSRDAYLPHPEHERVKKTILPVVAGVLVYDFAV